MLFSLDHDILVEQNEQLVSYKTGLLGEPRFSRRSLCLGAVREKSTILERDLCDFETGPTAEFCKRKSVR